MLAAGIDGRRLAAATDGRGGRGWRLGLLAVAVVTARMAVIAARTSDADAAMVAVAVVAARMAVVAVAVASE